MTEKYCFIDNQIMPIQKARISPYDMGILRGYAIFDVIRTYDGKLFHVAEHLKRFREGAERMHLAVPYSDEEIIKSLEDLLKKNGFAETTIRLMLTGGESPDAHTITKPTFYILADELVALPDEYYEKGVKVVTAEYEREHPEAKTANYAFAIRQGIERKDEGAYELVYISDGKVYEASTSNIFIVKDGIVNTPADGVLHGITRNLVVELIRNGPSTSLRVNEREIAVDELMNADEVFLTASSKEILPVVQIDDKKIGAGVPGPVTLKLLEKFRAETRK